MELLVEILYCFGMTVLGGVVYTLIKVWSKIKADRKFDVRKFFWDNKVFWGINLALAIAISLLLNLEPDARDLIGGFVVVEDSYKGFVILGIFLAGGTNRMPNVKSVEKSVKNDG